MKNIFICLILIILLVVYTFVHKPSENFQDDGGTMTGLEGGDPACLCTVPTGPAGATGPRGPPGPSGPAGGPGPTGGVGPSFFDELLEVESRKTTQDEWYTGHVSRNDRLAAYEETLEGDSAFEIARNLESDNPSTPTWYVQSNSVPEQKAKFIRSLKGEKGDDGNDGANSSLPSGTIVAYYGRGDNPPSGWVFCDNSPEAQAAGAPDLRGRFIMGYEQSSPPPTDRPWPTDGNSSITLDEENIPPHTHDITIDDAEVPHTHPSPGNTRNSGALEHSHGFDVRGSTVSGGRHRHNIRGSERDGHSRDHPPVGASITDRIRPRLDRVWETQDNDERSDHTHNINITGLITGIPALRSATTANNLRHNHPIPSIPVPDSESTSHSHRASVAPSPTGNTQSIDIRPPFMALRYIMKL